MFHNKTACAQYVLGHARPVGLTKQSRGAPKGRDKPSRILLYNSGFDTPYDYSLHPSRWSHDIWDIPKKRKKRDILRYDQARYKSTA